MIFMSVEQMRREIVKLTKAIELKNRLTSEAQMQLRPIEQQLDDLAARIKVAPTNSRTKRLQRQLLEEFQNIVDDAALRREYIRLTLVQMLVSGCRIKQLETELESRQQHDAACRARAEKRERTRQKNLNGYNADVVIRKVLNGGKRGEQFQVA